MDKAFHYLIQLLNYPSGPDVPWKLNNHFDLCKTTFFSAELQQHPDDKVGIWLCSTSGTFQKEGKLNQGVPNYQNCFAMAIGE